MGLMRGESGSEGEVEGEVSQGGLQTGFAVWWLFSGEMNKNWANAWVR